METVRTMMLHAAIHWSETADATLWPMCDNHALWIYNYVPNKMTGISPNNLLSKTKFPLD